MIISFSILDTYDMVVSRETTEDPASGPWRVWETWGKLTPPGLLKVLAEQFPTVPQMEDLEVAAGALPDDEEAGLMADLEMLNGDPGDRILPLDYVSSGDIVQDLGLAEDMFDPGICENLELPSIDGKIYTAYFVVTQRNSRNPYGSRTSFAGVRPNFTCPWGGNCSSCGDEWNLTLCQNAWEKHPVSWDDSTIVSPGIFWVVGIFPRRAREGVFKTLRTRRGNVVKVQMKDMPLVLVRWLDERDFQPGILDLHTGERRERYSILPAWALLDIATGQQFVYNEKKASPVIAPRRREFRKRVAQRLHRDLWTNGPVHPRRDLGVSWWKVDLDSATVHLVYPNGRALDVSVVFRGESAMVRTLSPHTADEFIGYTYPVTPIDFFACQAVDWKLAESQLLEEEGTVI